MPAHSFTAKRLLVLGIFVGSAAAGLWALREFAFDTEAALPANSVCIDGADGVVVAGAVASLKSLDPEIKAAQEKYLTDQRDPDAGTVAPLRVQPGCPHGLRLPDRAPNSGGVSGPGVVRLDPVNSPSAYNIKLFIVGDDDAKSLFPNRSYLRMPYEFVCLPNGSGCAEVTTAIYIRAADATRAEVLREAILDGLGILSSIKYPNGHPPSEDNTTK